jgi:ABC-type multidrug transport system ATPase subunit
MIEIRNLHKSYGALVVLDRLDFDVAPGELVALLGPNGAGKSTLMQCILGITGFSGSVKVSGIDVVRKGKEIRSLIGYMPQAGSLHSDLTVSETMEFYASVKQVPRAEWLELLGEVELSGMGERKTGELSGGMRQRLSFAIARMGNPPVLLLDEPTAGLDRESKRIIIDRLQALARRGTAVLISTHLDHELSSIADRFVTIDSGRIVALADVAEPQPVSGGAR